MTNQTFGTRFIRSLGQQHIEHAGEVQDQMIALDRYVAQRDTMDATARRERAVGLVAVLRRMREEADAIRRQAAHVNLLDDEPTVLAERRLIGRMAEVFTQSGDTIFAAADALMDKGWSEQKVADFLANPQTRADRFALGLRDIFRPMNSPSIIDRRREHVLKAIELLRSRHQARQGIRVHSELCARAHVRELAASLFPEERLMIDAGRWTENVIHMADRSERSAAAAR